MKKQPKFLAAHNPMVSPDDIYIFHTQKPRFLAKVEGNVFEIIDDIDSMIEFYDGNIAKVEGLIKRMTEWYKAYKIHTKHGSVYRKN